ncbi:integrase [Pseudoruegeria aquimaris]|uniref:Integrase n=1 Tax=Pseudoruegeria aquimaris TaxID=393663 RepID=A0A1Y5SJN0_9RHOB|nr:tyrosine-type recombinase/integrase [Pseudoruegeria aquimaris]SLN42369.1 integrase [Pseudoruegeria aquimaris]
MTAEPRKSNKVEITDKTAKHAEIRPTRYHIKDTKVEGFTLRVMPSGRKTMAAMLRDHKGKMRTITIGTYPKMSIKEGRERCRKIAYGLKYGGEEFAMPVGTQKNDRTTLMQLLVEVQPVFAINKKGWRPRGGPNSKANMRSTIECVFFRLLHKPVEDITETDLAACASAYQPSRPVNGKASANGQVSRALAYLAPVFDWAAQRGEYSKVGAGRLRKLDAPDVHRVHDPSTNDPSISGIRARVLSEEELARVLPLLTYPAHPHLRRRNVSPEKDFGPIAMKFLFLTLARVSEVSNAKWRDINFDSGVWTRMVKATEGGEREDSLPLSRAALDLLKSLPGYTMATPDDFVFPNRDGGILSNWNRTSLAIFKASKTERWTRHDIRRTGSTLLKELRTPVETIDAILAHLDPLAKSGASGSAKHYLSVVRILEGVEDPRAEALNKLARAYEVIVSGSNAGETA